MDFDDRNTCTYSNPRDLCRAQEAEDKEISVPALGNRDIYSDRIWLHRTGQHSDD